MKLTAYKKAVIAALSVYFIWGFTLLASTLAQTVASPMVYLMYRFVLATLIMLVPVFIGKQKIRLSRRAILPLLIIGLCEPVIYFLGEQYGMRYTNSSFTGIFISIIPLFSTILAGVFFNERPTFLQWVFCLISVGGVIAISVFTSDAGGSVSLKGVIWLLIAVFSAGFYTVLNKKAAKDNIGLYERTVVTMIVGAVFFTSGSVVQNIGSLENLITPLKSPAFILSVIYVALFASAVGYTVFNYAITKAPVANVVSLNSLVTVISVVVGVVFLHEPFSLKAGIAMAVVVVGVWGVQKFTRKEIVEQ